MKPNDSTKKRNAPAFYRELCRHYRAMALLYAHIVRGTNVWVANIVHVMWHGQFCK